MLKLGPMPAAEAKKWFVCRTPLPQAKYRMICLAWAGGNSTIFRNWDLGPDVEVVAVELPGRNARIRETPLHSFDVIVERIAQAMDTVGYLPPPSSPPPPPPPPAGTNSNVKPLLIFGHSFGAMLSIHLARLLCEWRGAVPKLVIVSGMSPLDTRGPPPGVSKLDDDGLLNYLVNMGGVPPEVAANREMMNIFLPAIRADYTAIDNYTYTDAPPLPSRLVAFAGTKDAKAPPGKEMEGWRRFTQEKMQFCVDVFEGGHFFIKENQCGKVVVERVGKLVFGLED